MDRVFTDEEKIRKAIEISQRRNKKYIDISTTRVNVNNKKNYKFFKRMILQIIICLLIYIIFHLISTTNYVFSAEVMKNTSNILSYDLNLEKIYKDFQNIFINSFNKDIKTKESYIENSITNNIENKVTNSISVNNELVNNSIVADEKEKKETEYNKSNENKNSNEPNKEKTAMQKDVEKAKKTCKFQKPLSGTITSEFGGREATIKGMTTDHKGIDIAANSGTNIKSAMSGTVTVAGENSEYGKFIKIVNEDVMTVYAHCKTLKVKVGNRIKIGQTIATVGSTGNSTGPHLHFEIRVENRYINPRLVIDF